MPHLVLAEDSPTIQKLVQLCFKSEDIDVHCFEDGTSTLEYLKTGPADVLLADVAIPGLDPRIIDRSLLNATQVLQRLTQSKKGLVQFTVVRVALEQAFIPAFRGQVRILAEIEIPDFLNPLGKILLNLPQELPGGAVQSSGMAHPALSDPIRGRTNRTLTAKE